MKRVLKIFVHDLVGLSRNIFALIIAPDIIKILWEFIKGI